jgi:S1-C subfamily serine protease
MNDEPTDITPDENRDGWDDRESAGHDTSAETPAETRWFDTPWVEPATPEPVGASAGTTAFTMPVATLDPEPPARRGMFRQKTLQRAAGLGVVIILTAATTGLTVHAVDGSSTHQVAATASTVASVKGTSGVAAALATISPSVVIINDTITTSSGNSGGGYFGGGGSFGGSSTESAAGTGIVISSDGNVVTNAHVVNGATNITVTTSDGKKHSASIVGLDATADLAVIKIAGVSGLTPATFASSTKAAVGDSVIAVGNAEGYGGSPSVTEGIISAKNRSLSDEEENLSGLLQTDAAINPGNSGGPLVDTNGHVVGINTAVATGSTSEPAQNIGFSIPSDTVTKELPALLAGKGASSSGGSSSSSGAFLGVSVGDSSDGNGAVVEAVESGSPASSAGLEAGDVITAIGSTQITDANDLVTAVQSDKSGDSVTLTITRNGSSEKLKVTLGSASSENSSS